MRIVYNADSVAQRSTAQRVDVGLYRIGYV